MWTQAKVSKLRKYIAGGKAITPEGTNRHTNVPVDANGLTRTTWNAQQAFLAAFPNSPTKQNYAVDRAIRGGTSLSRHAKGEALDIRIQTLARRLIKAKFSAEEKQFGRDVFWWFVNRAKDHPLEYTNGKPHRGPDRGDQYIFDGYIWEAGPNKVRPLKPESLQHTDHFHGSFVPEVGPVLPPAPPAVERRTLKLTFPKMKGADVELVQRVTGAKVDQRWGKGVYGEKTVEAVKAFQAKHGLTVDGIVGTRETWPAILREEQQ